MPISKKKLRAAWLVFVENPVLQYSFFYTAAVWGGHYCQIWGCLLSSALAMASGPYFFYARKRQQRELDRLRIEHMLARIEHD